MNGIAQVPVDSAGAGDYRTRLILDDTVYVGNAFALEVRMVNAESNGGITAFDPGVYVEGCDLGAGATFMGAAWAQSFNSIYAGTDGAANLPELVQDFSDWRVIRYVFANNRFDAFFDGQLVYTLPYSGRIDFLYQITVRFKGSGLVDWIRLYDGNGQEIWREEFDDCNNMTPFPEVSALTAFATSNDTTVCRGEPLRLSASAVASATYQWTGPNGFSSGSGNPLLSAVSPADTGFYHVTATFANCIELRDSVHVGLQEVAIPEPEFLGADTTLCPGDVLTVGREFPCAAYQWQNGLSAPFFTVSRPGSYLVRIDLDGQTYRDTIRVDYFPLPQIELGNDTTLCPGETVLFDATLATADSYAWQDGSTAASFTVQTPGLYVANVTDVCGNTTSDTIRVDYFEVLQAVDLGSDTTLCPGETLTLDATAAAAVAYQWQDSSAAPTLVADAAGMYAVTLTDNCDNTLSDSIEIEYFEVLQAVDLGSDTTLCPGERVTLNATSGAAVAYQWQDGSDSATFVADTTGVYTVTLTDNCNNDLSDSIAVEYFDVLTALDLGNDTTLCPGESLTLDAADMAAVSYQWQDGSAAPIFVASEVGTYTVTLTDNCDNTLTDSISLDYFETIETVNLGNDTILCPGEIITLDAFNGAAVAYQWQDGSATPEFSVEEAGTYRVLVSDNCGNSASDEVLVQYFDELEALDLGEDQTICPGEIITLNAFDDAAIAYTWQDGSSAPELTADQSGWYAVTVRDNCGNTLSDSVEVSYFQTLTSFTLGSDTTLCADEVLRFDFSNSPAIAFYEWQDGSTSAAYEISMPGRYAVTVSDNCGNNEQDNITVAYDEIPVAEMGGDTTLCEGTVYRLDATAENADFYQWSNGAAEAVLPVWEPGVYTVTLGNRCGSNTYSTMVDFEYCGPCRTGVPTAFSPNGDGVNDELEVFSECIFTDYRFRVFDRWGAQVFVSQTPTNLWDGTFNGQLLRAGVYIWTLSYEADDGSNANLSGDVTLVR
jgi:gliding motility-associated-like protein